MQAERAEQYINKSYEPYNNMSNAWYPEHKEELNTLLESYLKSKAKPKGKLHGLIVPHAGYIYSGAIAGKAYSLLKNSRPKKAIILSPSHYFALRGIATHNQNEWQTPLGRIKILKTKLDITRTDISVEHAIDNQIPFLQKLNIKEVLPILVGEINLDEAGEIAKKLSKIDALFIISTDLSHFLSYEEATEKDKKTIKLIENTDTSSINDINVCGLYPLLIGMHLFKLKKWHPKLIEYKNSGDITGDKSSVVGYSSFIF